jgi:hypothetical protein
LASRRRTEGRSAKSKKARTTSAISRRAKPSQPRKAAAKAAVLAAANSLRAAIRRGDAGAAEQFLARAFQFIDAAGRVHSRRSVLAAFKASPRGSGARIGVRDYGRIALVTGSYKSAQADECDDLHGLDVWISDDTGWKALIHHNNVLARPDAPAAHAPGTPRPANALPPRCINPCEKVPYEPKSRAERDIITAFQTLECAVTTNDAREWEKHVADEFVVTRTRQHPTDKAARMTFMNAQKAINAETFVAEIERMKFWVLGDAAVMRADHVMPGNRRPPYRATRLWVKRDGRWQMAVSQQTTIQR